jgi:hypothetical protein
MNRNKLLEGVRIISDNGRSKSTALSYSGKPLGWYASCNNLHTQVQSSIVRRFGTCSAPGSGFDANYMHHLVVFSKRLRTP